MVKIDNLRVRLNKEGSIQDLVGWVECVVTADDCQWYFNNIRVKIKELDGKFATREEYPSKTIICADGSEKKVFYVKPINAAAYKLVNEQVVKYLKDQIKK